MAASEEARASKRDTQSHLNLLRQIFSQAFKFCDPIIGDPILRLVPEVKDLAAPKRKVRPVPKMILKDVLAAVHTHVVEAIRLTLLFGFRKGEAFRLESRHIDFDLDGVRLSAEEVKDDEDEFLPGQECQTGKTGVFQNHLIH